MVTAIEDKLVEILKKNKISIESWEADLFEYGLDSFNALDVIVEIERCFHIMFNDDELDLKPFRTVTQIRKLIEKKMEGV